MRDSAKHKLRVAMLFPAFLLVGCEAPTGLDTLDEPLAQEEQGETERRAPAGSVNEGCFQRVGEQMVFDNGLCASVEKPGAYRDAK